MKIDRKHFETVLLELIDENALACQGLLSILQVEYTEDVDTLAVTLEKRPRLQVNLGFLQQHATKEVHIKTVLLHEFLHVLLNHTEQFKEMDKATNLALDAVINHILHRTLGEEYSDFFQHYYKDLEGYDTLLRPALEDEINIYGRLSDLESLRDDLLKGRVVVDDLLDLASKIQRQGQSDGQEADQQGEGGQQQDGGGPSAVDLPGGKKLLGGHRSRRVSQPVSEEIRKRLDETLQSYNGQGIYRSPKGQGFGAQPFATRFSGTSEPMRRWQQTTWQVLRRVCSPDPKARLKEQVDHSTFLPVLNERDRRAFLRATWSPLMPFADWQVSQEKPGHNTVVYLDVSGSMNSEMQALVGLLGRLRRYIRQPFWAFSDEVAPAIIRNGVLEASTSGGTAMNCVLAHFAKSKADKAVVITDGYIERCDPGLLEAIREKTLHILVSRDGSGHEFERIGLPYHQLDPYPHEERVS